MTTPAALLDAELRRDGSRPFITAYDRDGNRVELSVATTSNWVAKTAGYFVDELGIEPGEPISVDPVLHWLTAVALLAGWAVGADVQLRGAEGAQHVEIPLDPMGTAFSRLVAAYPDRYDAAAPAGEAAVAEVPDLPEGVRLMTTRSLDETGVAFGLLGPLAAGGSVVYVAEEEDLEAIARAERVTHTAGVDVPGVPRLLQL